MAIGGETIGRAYVRILADGSGFGEDIRRQIEGEDGEFQSAGRNSSKAYNKGFDEERDRWGKKSRKQQLDDLNKSVGKMHAAGEFAGSAYGKGLQDFLHRKFRDVGDQMFADINDGLKSGRLDFDSLENQLQNLGPMVERATKKIQQAQEQARKEEAKRSRESVAQLQREINQKSAALDAARKEQEREATKAELAEQRRGKERLARAKRDLAQQEKAYAEHTRRQAAQAKLLAFAEKEILSTRAAQWKNLGDKIEEFSKRSLKSPSKKNSLRDELEQLKRVMPDVTTGTTAFKNELNKMRGALGGSNGDIDRTHNGLSRMGATIGKMFGKGSRNDFLNFFGGFVSIGPTLVGQLSNVAGWVAGLGQSFSQLRADSGPGLGGLVDSLMGIASGGLPTIAGAAIAAAASLEILFFTLGPLTSGLVIAAGAVLALAGALGFALVGGLVAVGGALVPFAAALGVGMLAMSQLSKKAKNKDFQKFTKGLREDWKSLQEDTSKAVFGPQLKNLKTLGNVLDSLRPLIMPVAKALGGLLKEFGKATGTKEFAKMMGDLGKTLGPMVTDLGHIAGNLGLAFIGAFQAAAPYVDQFLGWLEKVTKAMADAGKPGKGGKKSPLAQFFDGAVDSAKRVWDLITNVGDVLGTLFSSGKDAGDSMITKLATAAGDLNKWLTSKEGKDALKKLFKDAEKLFDKLGEIGGAVLDLIDALDTDTNRMLFFTLLDIAVDVIKFLADVFTWVDKINKKLLTEGVKAVQSWSAGWADAKGQLKELSDGTTWDQIKGHLKEVTNGTMWQQMTSAIKGTGAGLKSSLGDTGRQIKTALAPVGGFLSDLASQIGTSLAPGFDRLKLRAGEAGRGIQTAFSTVTTFFSGLATSIAENLGRGLDTIKQRLSELPGQIVQAFVNLPANIWTFVQQMIAPFVWLYNYLIGNSLIPDLVMGIVGWFARLPGMIAGALGDIGSRFSIWLAGVPQKIQSSVGLITGAFSGLAGKAIARAGNIVSAFGKWLAALPGKARTMATAVATGFAGLAGKIISRAGSIAAAFARWVAGLPGKAKSAVSQIISGFGGLAGKIISRAGSILSAFGKWVSGLAGKAKSAANNIVNAFSGVAGKVISKMGSLADKLGAWGRSAVSKAKGVANNIVSAFSGLASRIVKAIGDIVPKIRMPKINIPTITAKVKVPKVASGGVFSGPQFAMIGEAGPEAVVPLARSLSRVDPAVRALSAFAQGISAPGTPGGTGPSIGRQIDVGGITINTPTEDPRAVASEVVNRLTFAAYI